MAEFSTPNLINTTQPTADQMNTPSRQGMADIATILSILFYDTAGSPSATHGTVFAGFDVAGRADMQVDVGAGAGVIYDVTTSAPQSPFQHTYTSATDQSPTLSDGDGANPRLDLISLLPVSALLDEEPMAIKGGAAQNKFTRRGPSYTIVVTEGTPGVAPVLPSTPPNNIRLAKVEVPAGHGVGAGGTATCTITGLQNYHGLSRRGPFDTEGTPLELLEGSWTGDKTVWSVEAYEAFASVARALLARVDKDEYWPYWRRIGGETGGETTADLYPLVAPGRQYWETVGFGSGGGQLSDADASVEHQGCISGPDSYTGVRIAHLTANGVNKDVSCEFPTPARKRSFTGITIRHEVFTAAPTSITAQAFLYDLTNDSITAVSAATALATGVGSAVTALSTVVETAPDVGQVLVVRVNVTFAAAGDASIVHINAARAHWYEGRDHTT